MFILKWSNLQIERCGSKYACQICMLDNTLLVSITLKMYFNATKTAVFTWLGIAH